MSATDSIANVWFRSGDVGTTDADDIHTIVDREKDMLVRNGYNVHPSEVIEIVKRDRGLQVPASRDRPP